MLPSDIEQSQAHMRDLLTQTEKDRTERTLLDHLMVRTYKPHIRQDE